MIASIAAAGTPVVAEAFNTSTGCLHVTVATMSLCSVGGVSLTSREIARIRPSILSRSSICCVITRGGILRSLNCATHLLHGRSDSAHIARNLLCHVMMLLCNLSESALSNNGEVGNLLICSRSSLHTLGSNGCSSDGSDWSGYLLLLSSTLGIHHKDHDKDQS